jgi:predicted nucleic acid-binding protein
MTFADIPAGAAIFVDASTFIYYFGSDPARGPACERLLEQIEQQQLQGFTSAQVLSDVAHRLMAQEACLVFGWPVAGIAQRLKRHPDEVKTLIRYQQAIDEVSLLRVQVLPVSGPQVSRAADVSRQTGLLSNDGLVVVVMRDKGLTQLASADADFDRVPGLTRYAPI